MKHPAAMRMPTSPPAAIPIFAARERPVGGWKVEAMAAFFSLGSAALTGSPSKREPSISRVLEIAGRCLQAIERVVMSMSRISFLISHIDER